MALLTYEYAHFLQGSSLICGINSTEEKIEKGENLNCRVYSVSDDDKWVCSVVLHDLPFQNHDLTYVG